MCGDNFYPIPTFKRNWIRIKFAIKVGELGRLPLAIALKNISGLNSSHTGSRFFQEFSWNYFITTDSKNISILKSNSYKLPCKMVQVFSFFGFFENPSGLFVEKPYLIGNNLKLVANIWTGKCISLLNLCSQFYQVTLCSPSRPFRVN